MTTERKPPENAEYVCPDAPHSCPCTDVLEAEIERLKAMLAAAYERLAPTQIDGSGAQD